ncbi:helix-turn-helix transcriptional regulator [Amycolatopsis jejuensis]|uniref:helix-turn-helix transcriptional regulator n=1 Tax=Amycolatopsis jejuensis TaxID=330084 RepID=UPI000527C56C|nr:YafY family protein [Amycolatopsis jejuensis]
MSRPIARVLALLEILQSGGTRTVGELAGRLEVDERTVRRYVDHLLDLDVPVRSVRGRYGGYRLAPGYRMPPLMLTGEEALAVVLGLVAGRRAGSAAAVESAVGKVRRVLPEALGRRLDALLTVTDFTTPARPPLTAEAEVLLTVAEAARDRHAVRIAYTAAHGRKSSRIVQPYGVVAHSGRWYLTGFDSAGDEVRTFRVDRITRVELTAETFAAPTGFDPADHLLKTIAETPHEHEVVVHFEAGAEEIRTVFPPSIAVLEATGSGVRARIRAQRLDWIPSRLAALDRPFVIEKPTELRDLVHSLAARLSGCAAAEPDSGAPSTAP